MGHWLLHALGLDSASGTAYLALSGIVGDLGLFATAVAVIAHAVIGYRRQNCEVHRCPRIVRHTTAAGHRVCRRHMPGGAPTHAEVIAAHHAARARNRPAKTLVRKQETGTTGKENSGGDLMQVSKLSIDGNGRVTGTCPNGHAVIHNQPFPCINGTSGGFGTRAQIRGLIPHTQVGNSPGTISVFNRAGFDASAHFVVDQAGQVVQMGPVGPGRWKAWAEAAGNLSWFSCEMADNGNPDNPYTTAQIQAAAQLLELLSRPSVGNFPMQVTNSTGGLGVGTHNMGSAAWGGHSCPDEPPQHVRSNQRNAIIEAAKVLRGSGPGHKPPPPPSFKLWTAEGMLPLAALASNLHTSTPVMIAMTAEHSDHAQFTASMTEYLSAVFAADHANMGPGLVWHYASNRADREWVTDPGDQPLSALAAQLKNSVPLILQMTAERSPDGAFQGAVAQYVTGVMARSQIHVPHGTVLAYP